MNTLPEKNVTMNGSRYSLLLSLNWIPKILCILFAIFISFFAMDVLGQGENFLTTFIALMAHLIPAFLVVIILILSWKWPWIGGICFIILGTVYVIMMEWKYLIIYIPLFLVGILFLLSWFFRKEIKEAQTIYRE